MYRIQNLFKNSILNIIIILKTDIPIHIPIQTEIVIQSKVKMNTFLVK